jgi:leucyl-tRNA synthetase
MFPYPSGAGLHVGHPLGYIASDIFARYKRQRGFNVLHPMGYDSFGLPAEQYAIQTGQHPAVTTEANIARYRDQLEKLGFSFDWSREVRTSDPGYYRWTQWIFAQLFDSWYDQAADRARPIAELVAAFEENGNFGVEAACTEGWWKELGSDFFGADWGGDFTATDWISMPEELREDVLMAFRLAYLADSEVNWCPALGTVLANDEVKDGLSERGGHPVERKRMRQWIMRIAAYADRLLRGLEDLEWTDSVKEAQRNWIGRSEGAVVRFALESDAGAVNGVGAVEVFTTRPDTLYGVSFLVLAPEHPLVDVLTAEAEAEAVGAYRERTAARSERERQGDREMTGVPTGGFVLHPLTGSRVPVWIADYVLAGYGTGAIMGVPAGDERDHRFATAMGLPIPAIFVGADPDAACTDYSAVLTASGPMDGLTAREAIPRALDLLESAGAGERRVQFRLRDAVFSRQRYWGEPFPICYVNGRPRVISDVQVTLPPVDAYLPTADGEPPLARAQADDWNVFRGERMECNTMPGWAGSSWYFLRYMDPHNENAFCDRSRSDYWGPVDLYIGGAEHTTGHLLYARFWTQFLFDRGWIGFPEPFRQMINQGMILGRSSFVYRIPGTQTFVTYERRKEQPVQQLHVDISLVQNDLLDLDAFRAWRPEFADATFVCNESGQYRCGFEVEKMSKSKFNVQTPDELVDRYGADTLRCYEMFLGPLTQHKPWDTQGISGVHNFLRKFTRLYTAPSDDTPSDAQWKSLHKTIRKVTDDLDRHAFNTVISAMMIGVNALTEQKTHSRAILQPLALLLAPCAPHLAQVLWETAGGSGWALDASWPAWEERWLVADTFDYPVSFNGKVRFKFTAATDLSPQSIETLVLADARTQQQLGTAAIQKVIVVSGRIINIVSAG